MRWRHFLFVLVFCSLVLVWCYLAYTLLEEVPLKSQNHKEELLIEETARSNTEHIRGNFTVYLQTLHNHLKSISGKKITPRSTWNSYIF